MTGERDPFLRPEPRGSQTVTGLVPPMSPSTNPWYPRSAPLRPLVPPAGWVSSRGAASGEGNATGETPVLLS